MSAVKREPAPALVALVGASFVVRTVLAWLRSTPALFPDEYIYTSLGRSLADSGRPLIRGGSAHFPALLQPLVTAPAWLIGDVGIAFRVVQAMGVLAMSLAAVPVYRLGRRLGLGTRVALALGAFAVLVPDLLYASFITSEAFAYPLLLASVYAATRAIARPTRRAQLAFVAAAGLATLARIQFAVLPVVFALAIVVVGLRERRLKAAVRLQALPLVLFAVAAAGALGSGPSRTVGAYRWLLGFHAGPLGIAHWAALDAMTLAYAAGWIVVPGALIGLLLALARPRSTDELAFGAVAVLLAAALLFEAGLLQASLPLGKEIQERYVFYAVPLLGLCFALYASRGWPLRLLHLALAAALVLVSVRVPLSGYAVASTLDGSTILFGVYWLTGKVGTPGGASILVAAAVGLMSLVAVLGSRRPRLGTPTVLGLALLATGAASAGAVTFNMTNTSATKRAYLPADASFVDRSGLRHVALLQTWGGHQAPSLQHLFWNRSIDRVLLMPDAPPIDAYRDQLVRVGKDGSLLVGGVPFRAPVVVDGFGSVVRLRGAYPVARGPVSTLWAPVGTPRLSLYATGSYHDGWLADSGAITVWATGPGRPIAGWISLRLTAPRSIGAATLTFTLPQGRRVRVRLLPGTPRRVRLPVCATGSASVTYRSSTRGLVGLRLVGARATPPVFTPGPAACPPSSRTAGRGSGA